MKDRINIDGEWYVREVPEMNLLFYKGCEFQTERFLFEFSLGDSFCFLKVKNRNDGREVLWDNEGMIKALAKEDEDWSDVALEVLEDANELKALIEFLKILKQKDWL